MTKREEYQAQLRKLTDWIPFLLKHSNLPGPRGNLELAQAAADEGNATLFESFLSYTPDRAPVNTPEEFVAVCGAIGFGRLAADGEYKYLRRLRALAEDPRWRMREGVAMGLQRVGEKRMVRLLREMSEWSSGPWLVQRAAAAGLCEPSLLQSSDTVQVVLRVLDAITGNLASATADERRSVAYRGLRQAMGYCWSVAIVSSPILGKGRFEKWFRCEDTDVRWVLRENLRKKRLERMDPNWVRSLSQRL